jgi:transcriptional antiterminator NusG
MSEEPAEINQDAHDEPTSAEEPDHQEQQAQDTPTTTTDDQEEPLVMPGMNWFVLRVASNKEDYVKETLTRKIKIEGFTHLVNRILVPTEREKQIKNGKQKIIHKKLYPGYVFVEMKLEPDGRIPQDVFFLIKETTGVGDFIGAAGKPSPMPLPEVQKIIEKDKAGQEEEEAKLEVAFQPGDPVKIKEGPFENLEGKVEQMIPEKGMVRVIVTIFNRPTPIDLDYWKVERAGEE